MIQPHPSAPLGEVRTLPHYYPRTFNPTSAILCRNTAPLIAFAFACIEHGIGVRVLGRDIGQGLVTTLRSCHATSLDELEMKLIQKRNREAKTCRAAGNESGACAVEDKYDCLNIFVQQAKHHNGTVFTIESQIENLFDERRRGLLTLSTIHKAKGLEWPTVFILDAPALMPSRWATLPWQKTQERNLHYVAVTRAKLNLFYIESDRWWSDEAETTHLEEERVAALAEQHEHEVDAEVWFQEQQMQSVRITSNPDDPNCYRRIP